MLWIIFNKQDYAVGTGWSTLLSFVGVNLFPGRAEMTEITPSERNKANLWRETVWFLPAISGWSLPED